MDMPPRVGSLDIRCSYYLVALRDFRFFLALRRFANVFLSDFTLPPSLPSNTAAGFFIYCHTSKSLRYCQEWVWITKNHHNLRNFIHPSTESRLDMNVRAAVSSRSYSRIPSHSIMKSLYSLFFCLSHIVWQSLHKAIQLFGSKRVPESPRFQ